MILNSDLLFFRLEQQSVYEIRYFHDYLHSIALMRGESKATYFNRMILCIFINEKKEQQRMRTSVTSVIVNVAPNECTLYLAANVKNGVINEPSIEWNAIGPPWYFRLFLENTIYGRSTWKVEIFIWCKFNWLLLCALENPLIFLMVPNQLIHLNLCVSIPKRKLALAGQVVILSTFAIIVNISTCLSPQNTCYCDGAIINSSFQLFCFIRKCSLEQDLVSLSQG